MQDKYKRLTIIFTILTLIFIGVFCYLFLFGEKEDDTVYVDYDVLSVNGVSYRENLDLDVLLLVGLDSYGADYEEVEGAYTNSSLADFIVLFVLDNDKKTVTPIQINRDSMVNYPVLGVLGDYVCDAYGQIALSHTYGDGGLSSVYNVKDAVSDLFCGVHIDYCLSITMDAIGIVNDDLGGIEVFVEDNFDNTDPSLVQGTLVKLSGEQAQNFVRSRMSMDEPTNIARMKRQRVYLESLFSTFVKKSDDQSLILKIINDVDDYFVSSANTSDIQTLVNRAAEYELADTVVVAGEAVMGEQYMEYYINQNELYDLVVEQFVLEY